VGDALGRVWGWGVGAAGEAAGGRADHWFQDPARQACAQCHQRFSLTERRHHCRNCGQIFCAKYTPGLSIIGTKSVLWIEDLVCTPFCRCSRYESDIRHLKISKPVRVCQNCYIRLKVMETGAGSTASH